MPRFERGYVICSYARSGSTMLAEALRSTGQLGRPQEYFNPRAIVLNDGEVYPSYPDGQVAEIRQRGTTANGVYGLKLFCDQFDDLRGYDWAARLPNLHYVHLERRDVLGSALSWVRATQTNQWDSKQPLRGVARYDEAAIVSALQRLAGHRARWTMFFARNGITPLNLVYEDMAQDVPKAVDAIAALMGIDANRAVRTATEPLKIQRDELSDEWRERFLASRANLALLDPLATPSLGEVLRALMRRTG